MANVKFKYKKGDLAYLHIHRRRRYSIGIYGPSYTGWFLSEITHCVPRMKSGKLIPCYNLRPLNSKQTYLKRELQLRDRIRFEEAGGPI